MTIKDINQDLRNTSTPSLLKLRDSLEIVNEISDEDLVKEMGLDIYLLTVKMILQERI